MVFRPPVFSPKPAPALPLWPESTACIFFSSYACYSVLCLPPATHTGAGWHRMRQFILATGYSSGSTSDFNGLLGNLLHLAEWLFFSCIIACPNCCGCCLTVAMCMCVCVAALCLFGPFSKLPVWRPENNVHSFACSGQH